MADSCTKMRRKLIKHGHLNSTTGQFKIEREEWVTEPCNIPLFGEPDKSRGTCKSCHTGWTHPENYPVANGD